MFEPLGRSISGAGARSSDLRERELRSVGVPMEAALEPEMTGSHRSGAERKENVATTVISVKASTDSRRLEDSCDFVKELNSLQQKSTATYSQAWAVLG